MIEVHTSRANKKIEKIIFLGTGPTIPVRGRGKNYRTNSSILVQVDNNNILIDATPMIEEQLLRNNISKIDAVLLTHGHADAIKGLPIIYDKFGKVPVYASGKTFKVIKTYWKALDVNKHILKPYKKFEVFGITFTPIPVIHAEPFPTGRKFPTFAYRFDSILYAEDMEAIPKESEQYFKNLNLLILDAAMYFGKKIRGHLNTEQALAIIQAYKPTKAILTQIGRTYPDHYKARKRIQDYVKEHKIPVEVQLGYDGMIVTFNSKTQVALAKLAIYLVKPHAELIYNNEKKLIIKSRKYPGMLNKNLYLLDDKLCYGIIKLTGIRKINLNDFKKLTNLHKITDRERKKWWGNKTEFYAYEFEFVERFSEPKPVKVPAGAQTYITDFEFATSQNLGYSFSRSIELIQNIYEYDPRNLENKILMDDFRLCAAYYSAIINGKKTKFTKEQIIELATKILKEILYRKKEGKMNWTANPDAGTEAYKLLWNDVKLTQEEKEFLKKKDIKLSKTKLLDKLLSELHDHIIIKDFVNIVGSTVEQGEGNDLDVLIRLNNVDYMRRAVQTLIQKKLNQLRIAKKVHAFMEAEGPHDSYIPIFDLALIVRRPFIKVSMAEEIPIPYLPQKPYGSAYNKIEDIINKLKPDIEYFVEKKFNGFHVIVIKKGDKIRIFSEQKKEITPAFKTLVEDIKKLGDKDFYVDGELVPYDKSGKALGRRPLMKYIGAVESGKEADDSNVKLHIWDIIYYDGKDLRTLPLKERKEYLKKLKLTDRITDTPYKLVKGKEKLEKAIKWAESLESSEGAVVKEAESPYIFDEKSRVWLKYHKLVDIDCVVIKRNETKAKGVYNYQIGIYLTDKEAEFISPDRLIEFKGRKVLDLKNTFNTDEKYDPGDVISVAIEDIWRHETLKGTYYSIHKPKVRHITEKKNTTSLDELDNLVTSIGYKVVEFSDKPVEIFRNKLPEETIEDVDEEGGTRSEAAKKYFEEYWHEMYPKSGKGEYVLHGHWRGLSEKEAKTSTHRALLLQGKHSIHSDLRLSNNGDLHGFTIFEGSARDIPIKEGSKLIYMAKHKGEQKFKNLEVAPKLPQPRRWLYIGRDKPHLSPPKDIGSTTNKWAKFFALDWGAYQLGTIRKHMREYFLNGKEMKGRVILMYAPVGGQRRWLIDFPKHQTPYAESHKLEDVVEELKQKKQKWLIWCKPGEKPQKIDVKKF